LQRVAPACSPEREVIADLQHTASDRRRRNPAGGEVDFEDSHIGGPGAVGVWTKADSVTAFDDFAYRAGRP
jgi:hypothetical protein